MKKAFVLTLSLTWLTILSFAQSTSSSIPVDTLFKTIKSYSVHRENVDWNRLTKRFEAKLDSAKTADDTLKCFVFIFKELNDVHSSIYYKNKYYGHYKGVDKETAKKLKPLLDRTAQQTNKIKTELVADHYGYIQIPGFQAFGDQSVSNKVAQAIQDSLCQYKSEKIDGYIVDLRLNGGGNLFPMLTGLSSFLGNGPIGGNADESGKLALAWSIRNGNYYQNDYPLTTVSSSCSLNYTELPVVMLLGPSTRSSGEATAIAFKHRKNTYFIGNSTPGGYTTSNAYWQITGDLALNLSTSYFADRQGNVYRDLVEPDLVVEGADDFDHLRNDPKVSAALKWLKTH